MWAKIGTLNAQTLHCYKSKKERDARFHLLIEEMNKYKIDIMCVSETHLTGFGTFNVTDVNDNQFKVHFSGVEEQASAGPGKNVHRNGVAIVLSPKVQKYCPDNEVKYKYPSEDDGLSGRVMSVLVAYTRIVLIYAPRKCREREEFMYQSGGNFTDVLQVHKEGPLIVTGDFNEKLVPEQAPRARCPEHCHHIIPPCKRMNFKIFDTFNFESVNHFFYRGRNKIEVDYSYDFRVTTALPTDHKDIHCFPWKFSIPQTQPNINLPNGKKQFIKGLAGKTNPCNTHITTDMKKMEMKEHPKALEHNHKVFAKKLEILLGCRIISMVRNLDSLAL